jgi:hypothetical protein
MGMKLVTLMVAMLLQRYQITPQQPLDDRRVLLNVTLRPARPQWVELVRRD